MAFTKRTAVEVKEKEPESPPKPLPVESANSRSWRQDAKASGSSTSYLHSPENNLPKGGKNVLIQVAGMFMHDKNGKQYFRGKTMKNVGGYGVLIPVGITFLLFESKEGSKVDGNLVLTLDPK